MKQSLKLLLGLAFAGTVLAGLPAMALAQDNPEDKIVASLELENADVREALRGLFRNVGVSYSLAPEVQGTVTVNLKNVTFAVALRNVLGQVNATYRVEGGVYQILLRESNTINPDQTTPDLPAATNGKVIRRIKIRSADPSYIAMLIGTDGGSQNYYGMPEPTAYSRMGSGGGGFGGQGGGGFGGMGGGGFGGMGGGGFGGQGGGFGGMGGGGFGGMGGGGGFGGRGGGGGFGGGGGGGGFGR